MTITTCLEIRKCSVATLSNRIFILTGKSLYYIFIFFRYNVEDLLQAYRKSRSGRDGMDTLANVDEICRGMFILIFRCRKYKPTKMIIFMSSCAYLHNI